MWLLLFASLASAKAPACNVVMTVNGEFSAEAAWLVNRINAPEGDLKPPPPLAVKAETLAALNAAKDKVLADILKEASLTPCPAAQEGVPALRVDIGGYDEVGGQYGGLTVRLGWQDGKKASQVMTTLSTDATPTALRAELGKALGQARGAAAPPPAGKAVVIAVRTAGMTEGERKEARSLVTCVAERYAWPAALVPGDTAEEARFAVDVAVTATGEPLDTAASALQGSIGAHAKFSCTLFGGPLAAKTAVVTREGDVVVLSFR